MDDERKLIVALLDALVGVMSSDPDMPTHGNTIEEAEAVIAFAEAYLKDTKE